MLCIRWQMIEQFSDRPGDFRPGSLRWSLKSVFVGSLRRRQKYLYRLVDPFVIAPQHMQCKAG